VQNHQQKLSGQRVVVNLSGRGDKDLATIFDQLGLDG
jgi:tryptophan synthase beta subunit